jgi:hypothetical protein
LAITPSKVERTARAKAMQAQRSKSSTAKT